MIWFPSCGYISNFSRCMQAKSRQQLLSNSSFSSPEEPGDVLFSSLLHLLPPLPLLLLHLVLLFISLCHFSLLQEPGRDDQMREIKKSVSEKDSLSLSGNGSGSCLYLWSGLKRVSVGGRTACSCGVSSFDSRAYCEKPKNWA